MKTLLIDNYDSFTYNLFQLIAEANGEEPTVVRNDGTSWSELAGGDFDNVVISPGPGRPDDPKDFGICADAIREAEVPLLGVCLGHQGIGHISGAEVVHAPEVMHGRMSAVYHDDSPLFAEIPQGFTVVRYHSLCITEPLPEDLEAIAWTADGIVMGAAHRTRPVWGVQFHPESICTDWGRRLLANFRDLTAGVAGGKRTPLTQPAHATAAARSGRLRSARACASRSSASTGSTTPSRSSSTSTATTATPSGSTAARSTSARASRSWAPAAARSARS